MGIIYETIRKVENTKEDAITLFCKDAENYISFTNFIELLEIYSEDTTELIAKYLMSDNQFLKLDFYMFDDALLADTPQRDVFYRYRYNCYEHSSHVTYPTEDFLKDAIGGGRLSDHSWHYWKIEDLLAIESIVHIGLDEVKFKVIESAIESSPPIVLSYFNENEELKQQLQMLQNNLAKNDGIALATKLEEAQDKIADLESQLAQTKAELADKPTGGDKELNTKSQNYAAKIVLAMAQIADLNLDSPYACKEPNTTNSIVFDQIKTNGMKVSNQVIGNWLKLATEQSKDD